MAKSASVEPKSRIDEEFMRSYFDLNERIKKMATQLDEWKSAIKEEVKKVGVVDSGGSIILTVASYEAKLEARTSVSLDDEKAELVLKKNKIYPDCVEITISHEKVERAYKDGKITDAQMQSMTSKKVIHALKVKSL